MIIKGGQVGHDVTLGHNCNVFGIVGNNCKIEANTDIWKGVTLEDNVFVGPNATFTNDKNPRVGIAWKLEETLVREGASIGANATILCGITIGKYAVVGAGAVVTKDIPPYQTWVGNPARRLTKKD